MSFRIGRGEIFGFLGSNGCGKTTTMKMLTGLLPVLRGQGLAAGQARGRARSRHARSVSGFMSQSFSLYTELTVRQNLDLHARLFHLPRRHGSHARIADLAERFGLVEYLDETAENLPLGVRQRLSLAVAVIHEPEMLILDEPTSGVDPVARDRFWELLIDLSRNRGVTIFISTHFMNEAQRCDRISPDARRAECSRRARRRQIVRDAGADNLEDAFIAHLQKAVPDDPATDGTGDALADCPPRTRRRRCQASEPRAKRSKLGLGAVSLGRIWAYAQREAIEIRRDPIRLAFALLGPILLMIVFGYGISFDVENLVLRRARLGTTRPRAAPTWRTFPARATSRSRPPLLDTRGPGATLARRHASSSRSRSRPDFGRDLRRGRSPEVARLAGRRDAVSRRDEPRLCRRRASALPGTSLRARAGQQAAAPAADARGALPLQPGHSRASTRWCPASS